MSKNTIEVEIEVSGITLLSEEEFESFWDRIPDLHDDWWLRSPDSKYSWFVMEVDSTGFPDEIGSEACSERAVRPALIISNPTRLQIGDKFHLFDYDWTVISDTLALCDNSIGERPFRDEDWEAEDASDYETSDVKKFLESWLAEQMAKEEAVAV